MQIKIEFPSLAWNDHRSGIQVALTVSKSTIIRIDSLPVLDKTALRSVLATGDPSWVTFPTLKSALSTLFLRKTITGEVVDDVIARVQDALRAFVKAKPPKDRLWTEKKLMERAQRLKFSVMEIESDIRALEKGGKVFFDVLSAPTRKLFDVRDVFRRAESERKLVREASDVDAIKRRRLLLPGLIRRERESIEKNRAYLNKYATIVARREASLKRLLGELEELSKKLELVGVGAA